MRFKLPNLSLLPIPVLAFAALGGPAAARADKADSTIENSVVKVFSTLRTPDIFRPWAKLPPSDVSGTGVVIEGQRILTNAHVVLYASQIEIQANQAGDKIPAHVEAIAPEIDLAVLKLDDPSFFDTHQPLKRATTLPGIKDTVLAYGFPMGGTSLSITKGIVSRIEWAGYNYPVSGLRIQIDAAINPGNSGGPAVANDRMIGLAFSHLGGAENIGYIIPNEEIDIFLKTVADHQRYSKPSYNDWIQTLENSALRPYLHLAKEDTGVLISQVDTTDPSYPLKRWDLISKIGSTTVDDQGMFPEGDLRLNFRYLLQKETKGDKLPIEIVRGGKHLRIDVPVSHDRPLLIPWLGGAYPEYFILGPLVFSPASQDFVASYVSNPGMSDAMMFAGSPLMERRGDKPAFPGEELVIVSSPFFPSRLAEGYDNPMAHVVAAVNDVPVRNFRQFVELLRDTRSDAVVISFFERGQETLVFPRAKILAATEEILTDNGVREQAPPDILAVWRSKPAK